MEQLLYELYYCAIKGDDLRASEIIASVCRNFEICNEVIAGYRTNCDKLTAAVAECCAEISRLEKITRKDVT